MVRALALITLICLICLPASAESALSVNGSQISVGEANAWIWLVKDAYRDMLAYYENTLGIDYWQLEYANGQSIWESVKADAFKQLVMIQLFCDVAQEQGLALSGEDVKDCESACGNCDCDNGAFSREDLLNVLEKRLLAGKAYSYMLSFEQIDEDAVTQSVDKAAYTAYDVEYLFVPYYAYSADPDRKASYREELAGLSAFEGSYEDAARLSPYLLAGTLTLCPASEDSDPALLDAALKMSVGDVSGVVETDYGLFLMRLSDDSDLALYEAQLEYELMQARKRAYQAEYNRLYASAEYSINAGYWDALTPRQQENN